MQYYKVLNVVGQGPYSDVKWNLPSGGKPGVWMPKVDEVEECKSGYHVCRRQDLIYWLDVQIYAVEVRGVVEEYGNKCVAQEARLLRRLDTWNDTTARLFAADCAEQVLPIFEKERPDDIRPREAIEAARKFAHGEITPQELSAAWDAAWAAAEAAAEAAARAARVAARAAARVAAWDAAEAAARAAAWDAAWDAAEAAARAAAWDAAWDAAEAAAWAAARDAAWAWQTEKLFEYLKGTIGARHNS